MDTWQGLGLDRSYRGKMPHGPQLGLARRAPSKLAGDSHSHLRAIPAPGPVLRSQILPQYTRGREKRRRHLRWPLAGQNAGKNLDFQAAIAVAPRCLGGMIQEGIERPPNRYQGPCMARRKFFLTVTVFLTGTLLLVAGCGEPFPSTPAEQGAAYVRAGRYDDAIASYTEAIRLSPRDAEAYLYRGRAHHCRNQANDIELAIADFTQAIDITPKDPEPYYSRSLAYRDHGDAEKAQEDDVTARARSAHQRDVRATSRRGVQTRAALQQCKRIGRKDRGRHTLGRSWIARQGRWQFIGHVHSIGRGRRLFVAPSN